MDDTELLQRYANTACQDAFAKLVDRHINLVYASARRLTRDEHLAEDVTQGVFIVLARKAGRVRNGAVLPAWLHSTTRNVCANVLAVQSRRRIHEQKAAAMNRETHEDQTRSEDDQTLTNELDLALARLATSDRAALVLRYLQGKSVRDVAAAMRISPEAAQKRVSRAVDRLRRYFAARGLALDESGMIAGLSGQTAQVAPVALASVVTSKSLSAAGATTGASVGAAGWAMRWLAWSAPAKVAAGVATAAIVLAASTAVVKSNKSAAAAGPANAASPAGDLPDARMPVDVGVTFIAPQIWQPYKPSESPALESFAIKNDGVMIFPGNAPDYVGKIDETTHRDNRPPALMVRSVAPEPAPRSSGAVGRLFDATPYRGKRLRLSAFLKTEHVAQQAAISLWVEDADHYATAQDDMGGRWLVGTNDWKRYDIVCDVAPDATKVAVQGYLRGAGAMWIDDMRLEVVGNEVPVNDDHRWRSWTFTPAKYKTTFDEKEQRNGHGTVCVRCDSAVKGDWNTYDHTLDNIAALRGKRVKFSAMIKSNDVKVNAGPVIRIVGPNNSTAKHDEQFPRRPVKGSMGWQKYATFINIPADAKGMSYGITMNEGGTIWFDEVKLEVVQGK